LDQSQEPSRARDEARGGGGVAVKRRVLDRPRRGKTT